MCLGILRFLDQAGLEVRASARGAAKQQVLLVDQAVQQVLLSVVVVDLEEGHHGDPKPGEPGSPQAKLREGRYRKYNFRFRLLNCLDDINIKTVSPEL